MRGEVQPCESWFNAWPARIDNAAVDTFADAMRAKTAVGRNKEDRGA
jgi:hypothetical protein